MNTTVLLATLLIATVCAGPLLFLDTRARRVNDHLREHGTEYTAQVIAYSIQHRKPVLTCTLDDLATSVVVPTYSDRRYRKGDTVRIRMAESNNKQSAELLDEPRRSIGRGVGISLGVGIVLLGMVLAALS
jgi:hypothetical protein